MVKAKILKIEHGQRTNYKLVQTDEFVLSANTEDELFEYFFREYDNRFKFICGLSYKFESLEVRDKYRKWMSVDANYAKAGGNMM